MHTFFLQGVPINNNNGNNNNNNNADGGGGGAVNPAIGRDLDEAGNGWNAWSFWTACCKADRASETQSRQRLCYPRGETSGSVRSGISGETSGFKHRTIDASVQGKGFGVNCLPPRGEALSDVCSRSD